VRRAITLLVSLAAVVSTALVASAPASAESVVLDRPRHGEDAVVALGDRLGDVAATHQTSAETLRARLVSDSSLWVDVTGRLFYVDPAPEETGTVGATTTTASTLTREFVLSRHSLPTAQRTVYLDVDGFGGEYGGKVGSAWTRSYTGGDGVAEPYSLDADVNTFSSDELADIYSIWQRVADDFAPFEINVTTQEPSYDAINRASSSDPVYGTRVAITSTANSCGCGGVAYVGVFDNIGRWHDKYQPAFVYNRGGKYVAEAATHEAGHNLGLSHDGRTKDDGTTEGYYTGHGDWAPIMGVGYYEAIVQWSKGEYAGANNTEDDFVVAGNNGGPLRVDATPSSLEVDAPQTGVIETAADSDVFLFNAPAGPLNDQGLVTVTFAVRPAAVSPDLDIRAVLTPASGGTAVHDANPDSAAWSTDVASGLGATFTADVAPSSAYHLSIAGAASGDAATDGYSTYGSLGAYDVSVTLATLAAPLPPFDPSDLLAQANTDGTITLQWVDGSTDEAAFELERWKKDDNGDFQRSSVMPLAADRTGQTDTLPAGTTWKYRLRALNSAGSSGWTAFTGEVTVASTSGGSKPGK
jgi:hypothetical protein